MCGIFGWRLQAAMPPEQRVALAAALALQNDERGGDSWGYWAPGVGVRRGLGEISPQARELARCAILAAHTRRATTGAATLENAHPFQVGALLGAHNGVIHNHVALNARYHRNCAVDSQHIFYHLAEGRPLDELIGYGAVWWRLADEDVVRLCRLSEDAELAVYGLGRYEAPEGTVWSSDCKHLVTALAVAGLDAFPYQVAVGAQLMVKSDRVYVCRGPPMRLTSLAAPAPCRRDLDPCDWRQGRQSRWRNHA